MSKAPSQGDDFVNKDLLVLVKIKRRVLFDVKRSAEDRDRLDALISDLITLLVSSKREYVLPEVHEAIAQGNERLAKRGARNGAGHEMGNAAESSEDDEMLDEENPVAAVSDGETAG